MATTTPNFGWSVPESTDLVKDGATAIELLGDSIDTSLVDLKGGTTGQVLSKTSGTDMDFTWVTGAANDLKLIQAQSFSAVSSQSLTSKFSATYDNYRLYYNITSVSTASDFAFRIRSASTDLTSATYNWKYAFYQVGSTDGVSQGAADTKIFLSYTTAANAGYVDILNPFLAQKTALVGLAVDQSTPTGRTVYANVNDSVSYDGLTIFPASGTMTGEVYLYGFNN
jgi:hypothetical protein